MNVFIIGAAGKVGRHLVPMLAAGGHVARAMHRNAEQADTLAAAGGTPVSGDIVGLSVPELAALMQGSNAVIFTAGAGGAGIELTNAVDGVGLEKAVAAAQQAGVARFLLVSAFPEARRGMEPNQGFENYMRVKKLADVHLARSGLDWVILRPGTLTDDPGTGRIAAGLALPYGSVPREDVAATLAAILDRPTLSRIIIELTTGDAPMAEALNTLA